MSEVQIKECHNVRILADLTHSPDIESTIKAIREKSKNMTNLEKYEFLKKHSIMPLEISKKVIESANETIEQQFQCDISVLRKPWLKKVCLVGDMRSGKSTMIEWIVELVLSIYEKNFKIFIIDSNSLQYNLDNLEAADVVIIITDDAVELQGSGQFMSKPSQKLAGKYYKIAHEYFKRTGKKQTFLICIFATQRWKDLDPRFRSAHITIFKNVLNTPEENKLLYALFEIEDFNILENHTILRNFNLPQYGATYAYFINAKYRGISEFPLPKIELDKIDVLESKLGGVQEQYKVMDIMNQFYRYFGVKIRWDDIATLFNNEKLGESYRIAFKRWHKQNFSDYSKKFDEIIKQDYYLRQLKRKGKKLPKKIGRNINKEIEDATESKKVINIVDAAVKSGFSDKELAEIINPQNPNDEIETKRKLIQHLYNTGKTRKEIETALVQAFKIDVPFAQITTDEALEEIARDLVDQALGEEKKNVKRKIKVFKTHEGEESS